ncbi:MAG TPA: ABC transporter ATP-binding protein [Clostridiales bacterium]|nr:ABC transporter ATP-binding protein [Clostridiales bacterium]
MKALEGRNLGFHYAGGPVLFQNVNIHVGEGECAALTGPSGSGKSTLCYLLSGIIPRSVEGEVQGDVLLFGEDIKGLSLASTVKKVGVVFQNPDSQLFSPTVEDEIAFGPENLCLPREEIGRRIGAALEAVNMSSYRLASPETLSGGQKYLIALSAVLALEPGALIFDEVFSQLDPQYTRLIKETIISQKKNGKAVLMVEHDAENLDIADRIYRMDGGCVREVSL